MRPIYSSVNTSGFRSLGWEVAAGHCGALKAGTIEDIFTANNFISRYTKYGRLSAAHSLFGEMSHRDTVSWNSMIAGYVNYGNFWIAWELLTDMKRQGCPIDAYAFGSILKGIACDGQLKVGEQLHSVILKTGYQMNLFVGSSLLDMYAKCKRIKDASLVFEIMPERNSISWNALIAGYVEDRNSEAAFQLFCSMEREGLKIEDGTVVPLLTLLDDREYYYSLTAQLHGKIIKHGLALNNTVCNAVIKAYSDCGSLECSEWIFRSSFAVHDIVTWNSMLAAYVVRNEEKRALQLFNDMRQCGFQPDICTYTSLISSCFEGEYKIHGKSLHGLVIKSGLEISTAVSNSIITMYLKTDARSVKDALNVFETMEAKDSVSWNSILTGFSQFGSSEDALKFFGLMRSVGVMVDHYTFSAVLKSCSDLATLQLGQQIHALAIKSGWLLNEHVTSSLIFLYSKCGLLEDARKSFEDGPLDSTLTWNWIIFGYAQHGMGNIALELFSHMRERKVNLDHITFVAVLTACSHAGLVAEGLYFLWSMESDFGIPLRTEHYACGIDLFGRAGLLDEAKALVKSMPFEPDAMVWKTLLGACRSCGDVELASQIGSHLLEIEPEEHCTYVLLSDLYSRHERWDEKASLKKMMKKQGIKKVPGRSWIEVQNEVHAFNAEDSSHPSYQEIYHVLGGLMNEIRLLYNASKLKGPTYNLGHLGICCDMK